MAVIFLISLVAAVIFRLVCQTDVYKSLGLGFAVCMVMLPFAGWVIDWLNYQYIKATWENNVPGPSAK